MSNLHRKWNVIELENGWLIEDGTHDRGAIGKGWVAKDLNDLRNLMTKLCSPEEKDEKRTASS